MKKLTAEEAAKADMKEEFNVVLTEDTAVAHTEPVRDMYSKSIEFIPNRKHGLYTNIGYINLKYAGHFNR
tara:strand:- start:8066 stop:8275 length:210 start_codon:yes stop_codon:yes gene_type:complete